MGVDMAVNGGTPTAEMTVCGRQGGVVPGKGPMLWCDVPVEMLLL
jgi:hypothetical protein